MLIREQSNVDSKSVQTDADKSLNKCPFKMVDWSMSVRLRLGTSRTCVAGVDVSVWQPRGRAQAQLTAELTEAMLVVCGVQLSR